MSDVPDLPEDDPAGAPRGLARQLLTGTERLEDVLARAAVAAHADGAAQHAAEAAASGTPPWAEAHRTVEAYTRLAKRQGAAAGAALTALETTSLWGTAGTLTIPAAVTALAGDLTSLAWVQARMVMHLAAIHGLDPHDGPARIRDLMALWGIEDLGDVARGGGGAWAKQAARRVSPRLRLRALLRLVGLRSLTRRVLPIVNVPLTARANAAATRQLGERAVERFRAAASQGQRGPRS